MNIMIINAHGFNRGDEAAVRAMIDELRLKYPNAHLMLQMAWDKPYPEVGDDIEIIPSYFAGGRKGKIEYRCFLKTGIAFSSNLRTFVDAVKRADIIIHAPGGPSIGDIYKEAEWDYLRRFLVIQKLNKPYIFYAPSMGPFKDESRAKVRKRVLNGAADIFLRDRISQKYVNTFGINKVAGLTLDSAFQHSIDEIINNKKLDNYRDLFDFLSAHKKIVGVTVTDLKWHPIYGKNKQLEEQIKKVFNVFLKKIVSDGYGVLFIPQLFGRSNDKDLMSTYAVYGPDSFVMSDEYDTYFQQYVIGKVYAVVGMRYHSNIFSAKMKTPFVSISYEQKMQGFMEMNGLSEYMIKIEDLNPDRLQKCFDMLETSYDSYKKKLEEINPQLVRQSYQSTERVAALIEKLGLD